MTRSARILRARLAAAVVVGLTVGLAPVGSLPAEAAKKPKPTTTTTSTTRPSTTTTTSTTLPPTTLPPTSTTTSTTVPPQSTGAEAVTYHLNPVHTGAQTDDPLTPDLVRRWTKDLGGPVSYPVVAEGKVFVTVGNAGAYGTKLYAFDLVTGSTAWGPVDLGGTYWWSAAAYETGRLFVLNYDGVLRAFDAATGTQDWIVELPGQWSFTSAPTAWQGVVYTAGAGSGGTLYAVDGRTGAVLWARPVANGDYSSPAVTDTDVYVSYACPNVYDFDRVTGAEQWRYSNGCSGGGGKTPAVAAGGVWVRDSGNDIVLDAETGAFTGAFSTGPIPAFAGTTGWFLNGTTLEARDTTTGTVLWTFTGDGRLTSAPVTANGFVYVGSASGNVYALRGSTGEVSTTVSARPSPPRTSTTSPSP